MAGLTQARLRELLNYNPETGIFVWVVRSGSNCVIGANAGSPHNAGYLQIGIDGKRYLSHRLAWLYVHGEWPPRDLDHRDNIRTHNWIENLRPATRAQNLINQRKRRDNTSGFKGVSQRNGGWRAQLIVNGKFYHLGDFPTPEQAHAAYCKSAKELCGEFARGE